MKQDRGVGEQNRRSWNRATRAHNSHKLDQATFLRNGGSTLFPEELELLGPLEGRRLLHLQCNAGQDSLSLAGLGAVVTGVDVSDEAIAFARRLSDESGIDARFDRDDLFDWLRRNEAESGNRFDVVFASYGAVPWLSDLRRWAEGIAGVLVTGGRLVLIEFHPVAMMFDESWRHRYPYGSGGEPLLERAGVGDYVAQAGEGLAPSGFRAGDEPFENPEPCYEFCWSSLDVVAAVIAAGLQPEALREYPYSNGCRVGKRMRAIDGRRLLPPAEIPPLPMMFSVVARKA